MKRLCSFTFLVLIALVSALIAQRSTEAQVYNTHDAFRRCWTAAQTNAAASRACIANAGPAIRANADFACFEAISFALSGWASPAQFAYDICASTYRAAGQTVPPLLARSYLSAVASSPAATCTVPSQPESDGVLILPRSGGGHVRGRCREGTRCEQALSLLDQSLSGAPVDLDLAQRLFTQMPSDLVLTCDSGTICDAFDSAITELSQGRTPTAASQIVASERAVLDRIACRTPTACYSLEQARAGVGGSSTILRRQIEHGDIRCVGDGCPSIDRFRPQDWRRIESLMAREPERAPR